MTDDAQQPTVPQEPHPPRTAPPRRSPAAPHRDRPREHPPQLGRGLVWSDLVREMEEEWAASQRRRAEAGRPVVDLPRPGGAPAGGPDGTAGTTGAAA